MKKMLLGIAIAAALSGCGSESLEDVKSKSEPVVPYATVKYDPSAGVLSVPNDLLFLGTTDGTLNMPGETVTAGESVNYADPQTSLGALDGWSTQSPYKIELTMPAGVELEETSVNASSVRIFEVVMGASLTDETCRSVPAGLGCKYVRELQFGVDFVASASGNDVAIVPMKPFTQGASYINVLTSALEDNYGRSIQPSSTYKLVKQDINELPLVTESQLALQGVINSYENVVIQSGSLTKDEIILSAAMTIQSAGNIIGSVKNLLAASLQGVGTPPAIVMGAPTGLNVGQVLGIPSPSLFDEVTYHKGVINLPNYLKAPTSTEDSGLNETYWQAQCDNAAVVAGFKAQAGDNFPMDPVSENDAFCLNVSGGLLRDFTAIGMELDKERHLTKYNLLPKVQGISTAAVQMTKPADNLTMINATRQALGMGPLVKPEAGWPVVIMQHGITSRKESMLALTASLALQGFATVAIDHPMHGERGIDVDGDGEDDFNATTKSVLHYMNLGSMLVARDNLRQSMADLLGLRLGLNFIQNEQDLNTLDVSFVGHSLGAISGPGFITAANTTLGSPQADALFKIQSGALASGAGGIAGFLLESESFGSFIQASVLLSAGIAESAEFAAFLQSPPESCLALFEDQQAFVSCVYDEFMKSLVAAGESQKIANISAIMSSFVFASQTALDAADPNSIYQRVAALDTPIYQSVVVGDGIDNKEDTVIPAYVSASVNPNAGTVPSALRMGLKPVTESQAPLVDDNGNPVPGKFLVKFIYGHHGSILTPAPAGGATPEQAGAATQEMQLQMASFLASRGYALQMQNTQIVTP